MEKLTEYNIPFTGLKTGKHILTYEIGKEFFDNFEFSPLKEGDIFVHLTFDKREDFFILDFFIDGSIITSCDRCLEDFECPVNGNYRMYYKFADEADVQEEESDVIYISRAEIKINVAELIYEYINLSVPIQKFCEMSVIENRKCNDEVLKYYNNGAESENDEEEIKKTDPRWDLLKDLNVN